MALDGWNIVQKFSMTIAAADIPSSQSDMPILMHLSESSGQTDFDCTDFFTKLGASGALKIAVELGDTEVQAYVELERYDYANLNAQYHVKWPEVLSTDDVVLNIYYDEAQDDNTTYVGVVGSTPGQAVFSNNYLHVYHKSQTPSGAGSVLDSLATVDGTSVNMDSSNLVDAFVGKGYEQNGVDEHVAFTFPANITTMTGEISVKATTGTAAAYDGIFSAYDDYGSVAMAFIVNVAGNGVSFYRNNSGESSPLAVADFTAWNHFSFSISPDSEKIINHVADTSASASDSIARYIHTSAASGRWALSSRRFPGQFRGLWLSSVVRSDDWLDISYKARTDQLITYAVPSIEDISELTLIDGEEQFDIAGEAILLGQVELIETETLSLIADTTKHVNIALEDSKEEFYIVGTSNIEGLFGIDEGESMSFRAYISYLNCVDGDEQFSITGNTSFFGQINIEDGEEIVAFTGLGNIGSSFTLLDGDELFDLNGKTFHTSSPILFDRFRRCHVPDITNYGVLSAEESQEEFNIEGN